jgi:sugar lactone lactonase YvrE
MRLVHLLPFGALLCLIPACGDDSNHHEPDDSGGQGGDSGGSAGSVSHGGTRTGNGGKPSRGGTPNGGTPNDGGMSGDGGVPGGGTAGEAPDMGGTGNGGMAGSSDGGEPPVVDCSKLAAAPAQFEVLSGFTSSEDFVFDELGNYVGVDQDNNLVRISKDGTKTLWAPAIGGTAGMGILPDGSVVIADVSNGAVKRVYPNSASEVVLGGLLYPNGLDIGPDGYIYVAENNAGRVRRIDPDTGEFTIVAMGLHGCNGVAFSNDPKIMYVGSFEGSGVYKVVIPAPGELGVSTVFARPHGSSLPEPELACPDQEVGKECTTNTTQMTGKCQQLSNVVDCVPSGPCDDVPEGTECFSHNGPGICTAGECVWKDPCEEDPEAPNCCQGPDCCKGFECPPPNPCAGLNEGDVCTDPWFGEGKCVDYGNNLYCEEPNPCEGLKEGDECTNPHSGPGKCVSYDEDILYCEPPNPCDGLNAGDVCTIPDFGPGVCVSFGGDSLYCELPNACTGKEDGTECELFEGETGVCHAGYCNSSPCSHLSAGDSCYDFEGKSGTCEATSEGPLQCVDTCASKPDGTECLIFGLVGKCSMAACQLAPCTQAGQSCASAAGPGVCVETETGLVCESHGQGGPGGIDGLGVDACGNVYASEYTNGIVWRISPTGDIERLADLPSGWIPNIKWGRGMGGFSNEVMYVADRDDGRLFGISVGLPGVTEFFDLEAK